METTKSCNTCGSTIPETATLCAVCKTYQNRGRASVQSFQSSVIPLIALVISIISLARSCESDTIAREALRITQATSKLDLEPKLRIDDYMGKNRPTYLRFFNDGPVPAIHVTVQLFQLGYDQNKKVIRAGISESPYSFYVESIRPKNSAIMPSDSKILTEREVMSYADAPKTEQPYYNDILEIRIRYYREADGKAFGGRKFFFRTQEKEWARENQSSFPREILAAALKWPSRDFRPFFDLNPLNE